MMKKLAVALLVIAGLAASANADVILAWNVQGSGSPAVATLAATTIDAGLSTAVSLNELSRVGLTEASAVNAYNSSAWNLGAFNNADDYISFSLTPLAGQQMSLSSVEYTINGSNTAPGTGRWGYQIASGGWVYQTEWTILNPAQPLATWTFSTVSGITDTVEFRFWAYGATSIGGGASTSGGTARIGNVAGNDLIVNGTVTAIPEPGVLALLSMGGLAVIRFARRRKA